MSKTILLTSGGMRMKDEILKLLPTPASEIQLAHIITASKMATDISYMIKDKQKMIDVGFTVEDIDIEGKNEIKIKQMLKEKDIIYVQGGDPFYLLKHIRLSGFDVIVNELINKGIIYIGASAGTMVAQPTIETALWQKPKRATHGLTDYTAMNLTPVFTIVHYGKNERYSSPEYIQRIKNGIKNARYPVYILTDQQAVLMQDDKIELVGTGQKIEL